MYERLILVCVTGKMDDVLDSIRVVHMHGDLH